MLFCASQFLIFTERIRKKKGAPLDESRQSTTIMFLPEIACYSKSTYAGDIQRLIDVFLIVLRPLNRRGPLRIKKPIEDSNLRQYMKPV